ncbi:MAG: peptidylprolyl isomerase [Bacteroidota bacterium]|nr:peptidylprolyl isomerase [Bacteroidota bacterium]
MVKSVKLFVFLVAVSLSGIASLFVAGCASHEAVVAEVGGEEISRAEFDSMYAKNNGGAVAVTKATPEELNKFLDLYVNFKLKVRYAYDHAYENDPGVQAELNEYRNNLATSYYLDDALTQPTLKEMYARKLLEVRASHILISLSPNAAPADTLQAYNTAMKIIDSLKMGIPFEQLALDNSQDPSVKQNKGDLYYFSSGMMVPDFENAVYSLKPGEFSTTPVRTSYGYHVIKVTDRKANPGSVRVSHIMKRLTAESTAADSAKAWADMRAALDSLSHGADFATTARNISDDKFSAMQGGDLGFIERRRTVPSFDSVAFSLKKGEMSGIITTPFGIHILKVTDTKPVGSFADLEPQLKSFYQRYRYQHDYNALVALLKKKYGFTVDANAIAACRREADTTKYAGDPGWDSSLSAQTKAMVVFTIAGTHITVDSVIQLSKREADFQNLLLKNPDTFHKIFDKIGDNLVIEREAVSQEADRPGFAKLMKEYEDGILLFKVEQNEVWNKVTVTDSALHAYYEMTRDKYTWPDRVNIQEIFVSTDSIANVVTEALKSGKMGFDSAAAKYNQRYQTKQKNGEWGLQPVTTNEMTKRAWTMDEGATSDFFKYENGYSMIKVLEKDPARDKTFEEANSEASSAYQEYESKQLENQWIEALRKKYPVVLHPEAINPQLVQASQKETSK